MKILGNVFRGNMWRHFCWEDNEVWSCHVTGHAYVHLWEIFQSGCDHEQSHCQRMRVSIIPASPPFGFFCLFVFVLMGNLYYYLVVLVLWWWWLMRVNSFFIFIDHLDILLCDVFIKWFCSFFCWALSPSFSPSLPHPFLSFLKYVFKKLELFDIYRKITKIVQGILVCFPPSFPQS